MPETKKREISIEYEEVVVIRKRAQPVIAWCRRCGDRASMLVPDDAARAAGLSSRALYRLIEAGRIHFTEASDGSLLVCAESLAAEQKDRPNERHELPPASAMESHLSPAVEIPPITDGEKHDQ